MPTATRAAPSRLLRVGRRLSGAPAASPCGRRTGRPKSDSREITIRSRGAPESLGGYMLGHASVRRF